jgi:heme exporter protein A
MPADLPPQMQLDLVGVSRRFGRRAVFSDIEATVRGGQTLAVTGANGSGKSTLLRIISGLLSPSAGKINLTLNGSPLDAAQRRSALGYVAPDLTLYAELSGVENLEFFARLRGIKLTREDLIMLLERVGLRGRGRDLVGNYSSGMRQRLKYAFALTTTPPLLLLDEPTANLDAEGVAMVESVVTEQRKRGIVVIGTNEANEAAWGDTVVRLGVPA